MIGQAADKIFNRVFVVLIMTVYFWLLTLAGLVLFGIGPATRSVCELYMDHKWQWKGYRFSEAWHNYTADFWRVNCHAWLFLGIGAVLGYNLYLSTTIKASWMLFIQFIILFALILDYSLAIFTVLLRARYDVAFKDALKLATVQFFSNFMQLLAFVAVTAVVVVVSLKWPGMILFLSPGFYFVIADMLSKQWYAKIDHLLEAI